MYIVQHLSTADATANTLTLYGALPLPASSTVRSFRDVAIKRPQTTLSMSVVNVIERIQTLKSVTGGATGGCGYVPPHFMKI